MSFLTVNRQTSSGSSAGNSERDGEGSGHPDDLEVDNSKSVLTKIATLYAEQLMSDLVLEVGGVSYPAHRLILCASSEVFQVMLMNRDWAEWRESHIVLQETPTAATVFPHFLKYFYTGQIKISHQTVLPVLSLADKYNVKDLVTLCLCYMSNHIAESSRSGHLVSWMQYTMACGHNHVARACQNYVKWNVERVWAAAPLAELEADTLLALLQQTELVLHNETALYHLVVRWLDGQRERLESSELGEVDKKAHWDSLVVAMFSHVRFPMMSPNELAKLLLSPITQEHKHFFMERMAIAMSYQAGQFERIQSVYSNPASHCLFTPRIYTEDTWGSVLAVDSYHSLPCYHTRTYIFSTATNLEAQQERTTEWTLDLYPKGVWFRKSMLIAWSGTYDVPEVVLRTVRISMTCQNPPLASEEDDVDEPDIRVKIAILVWGVQKGVEHISSVVERVHRFSSQNRVLNIDNALDFDELNTPLYPVTEAPPHPPARCANCNSACSVLDEPRHLLGPNRDQLKIQVVIMPLTDFCYLGPPENFG